MIPQPTRLLGEPGVRWSVALLAAVIALGLVLRGWVGADIDVWYGAGLVRALSERPLAPESLGHVPKLGHLLLLSPAVYLGTAPERWFLIVGCLGLVTLLCAHSAWARSAEVSGADLLVASVGMPLVWRGSLDAGSIVWAWSCVILALAGRNRRRRWRAWLLASALFRPEVVGVGLALGVVDWARRERQWWTTIVGPALVAVASTALIDLLWSGRLGASSIAHSVFEAASVEQVRGRWGFLDTAHPWLHLALPAAGVLAAVGFVRNFREGSVAPSTLRTALVDLVAATLGFAAVTFGNVVLGGTLFARFLLPSTTVLAAGAAMARRKATEWERRAMTAGLLVVSAVSWWFTAPEFAGTYPSAPSVLLARRLARQTAPELTVAMDAGTRAVSLGSGARPWRTTPWLLESPDTPCRSQVIIARGAFLRRIQASVDRCGPWRAFIMDSSQVTLDLQVLLARRSK